MLTGSVPAAGREDEQPVTQEIGFALQLVRLQESLRAFLSGGCSHGL
jgi:hypothetical protein